MDDADNRALPIGIASGLRLTYSLLMSCVEPTFSSTYV